MGYLPGELGVRCLADHLALQTVPYHSHEAGGTHDFWQVVETFVCQELRNISPAKVTIIEMVQMHN